MTGRRFGLFVAACVLLTPAIGAAQVIKTGSLAATGDTVTVSMSGVVSATFQLSGTWTGQVVWDATVDGSIWWPIKPTNISDGGDVSGLGVNGFVLVENIGFVTVRARAADLGSGTATVTAARGFGGRSGSTLVKSTDAAGIVRPFAVNSLGAVGTTNGRYLPLPLCNPVTRNAGNCR